MGTGEVFAVWRAMDVNRGFVLHAFTGHIQHGERQ